MAWHGGLGLGLLACQRKSRYTQYYGQNGFRSRLTGCKLVFEQYSCSHRGYLTAWWDVASISQNCDSNSDLVTQLDLGSGRSLVGSPIIEQKLAGSYVSLIISISGKWCVARASLYHLHCRTFTENRNINSKSKVVLLVTIFETQDSYTLCLRRSSGREQLIWDSEGISCCWLVCSNFTRLWCPLIELGGYKEQA